MKSVQTRIVISGYYGCGNTGDEAVLAGILESFRQTVGEEKTSFTVLSAKPEETLKQHGVAAAPRMDRSARLKALESADLFLSGGGSLLQDTTSLRSLVYYLWVVREAYRKQVPVVYYAQGIGPLNRGVSRFLTRIVTNRASLVTVRDSDSAELLKKIGVNRPKIEVTADPAFVLRSEADDRIDALQYAAGIKKGEKLIGIAVRNWSGVPKTFWRESVQLISAETGCTPLFLPMQPPGDLELSEFAANGLGHVIQDPFTPAEAIGLLARCDALIAMRLHALIFGAVAGVPVIGASYDPKVESLMKILGQSEQCHGIAELTPQTLLEQVKYALQNSQIENISLNKSVQHLSIRALDNARLALAEAK